MGKRSDFKRIERDFYPTPYEAVVPLIPHLWMFARFIEPCAGDHDLIRHLEKHNKKCVFASDVFPPRRGLSHQLISAIDVHINNIDMHGREPDYYITNPPWDREILHPIIDNLASQIPTWLLFDADWMHTKQSIPYMKYCHKIVSIGRVKWFSESKSTGKDNCCWYLFDKNSTFMGTRFYGREIQ